MRTSARPTARAWSLAALLGVALATTGARADPPRDPAHAHVDRANTHYKLGRFDQALAEYAKAYELFPAAALLFNQGQCHRGLRHHARAIFFFEGYLREKPDAPNRRLVEELIAECRRALAEQETQRRALEERRAAERDARALIAVLQPATLPFLPSGLTAGPRPRSGGAIFRRWWFWTAVAAALVAATGATLGYYYSGTTTRTLPTGTLGTLDRRGR